MSNRLAEETSPYLLQHKDNPVDWWPWGQEAFEEARRRDVPVFLSVGYSTCYWCHVMEREVFENEDLARGMNERFVCIKVDREQRPDVDEHYMTATQVLSGQGGWPMSVFLTPGGEPFFAGTYFPPTDVPGRPGFGRVTEAISDAWSQRREDLLQTVDQLREVLARLARPRKPEADATFDDDLLVSLVNEAASDFDPRHGGFGSAPKFPHQTLLETLLVAQHYYAQDNEGWEHQIRATLDALANGGIRDHLGGGFHRYSTDAKWLVPHFEIMLYDQAMLAWCFVEAYRLFESPLYGLVARRCIDFVLREMRDPAGPFYTAFDAEVDAKEGGPYLWTPDEVREVLGEEDAKVFNRVYGLDRGFNFADPHGPNPHTPDTNVLFLAEPDRDDDRAIGEMRRKLLAARSQRKQPMLDTKIITSWNGLMIRALAQASEVLGEPAYADAAARAAAWLLRHHFDGNRLVRSSREGKITDAEGVLDDYAHLARACVALWRTGGNEQWSEHAATLAAHLELRFEDDEHGGYFFTSATDPDAKLMGGLRRMSGTDNPLPSGNASAALLMLELDQPKQTLQVLDAFAGTLLDHPGSACAMLEAAIKYKHRQGEFTVAGGPAEQAAPPSAADEAGDVVQLGGEWVSPVQLTIVLGIADGFHLYAPGHEGSEVITELSSTDPAALANVDYPQSTDGTYRGQIRLQAHLAQPAEVGNEIELALRYQACDDTRCLQAVRKVFSVRLAER